MKAIGPFANFYDLSYIPPYQDTKNITLIPIARAVTTLFVRARCNQERSSISIDNIVRQNLAVFGDKGTLLGPHDDLLRDVYDGLVESLDSEALALIEKTRKYPFSLHVEVRHLALTDFGQSFCACCIDQPATAPPTVSDRGP